jgi:hypothetical protein
VEVQLVLEVLLQELLLLLLHLLLQRGVECHLLNLLD